LGFGFSALCGFCGFSLSLLFLFFCLLVFDFLCILSVCLGALYAFFNVSLLTYKKKKKFDTNEKRQKTKVNEVSPNKRACQLYGPSRSPYSIGPLHKTKNG
jgi:predicted membrane protein